MNQVEKDLELFLKYSNDENNLYQSETNPMHPNLFYQLSMVIGFNKLNGRNYAEYIEIWLKNYKK